MSTNTIRYPRINLRSKNDLAKRISGKRLESDKALILINDVIANFDKYWHDSQKMSDPIKNKYVRSAFGTKLGTLLNLINRKVLAPYDLYIPPFIFGGISSRSHALAAVSLLGKRDRVFCKLDLKRFFEQMEQQDIYNLFCVVVVPIKCHVYLPTYVVFMKGQKDLKAQG